MAPRLLPAALAFLVLGAHFLRAGHLALVVVALAVVALFFVRRPWAARAWSLLDAARRPAQIED
jgi:hypothetical protein